MTKVMKAVSIILWIMFAAYLLVLINFTLISGYYGRIKFTDGMSIIEYAKNHTNLIPFFTVKEYLRGYFNGNINLRYVVRNILGNLAAFAPFGFFLPLLVKSQRKISIFIVTLTSAILSIEFLQLLLMRGSFDIDDFILNFFGAFITFLIVNPLIKKKTQHIK